MELPKLAQFPLISIDTETTGLHWYEHQAFGISISLPNGQDYYWDIRQHPQIVDWLRDEIPHVAMLTGHNLKFDLHFLQNLGILPSRKTRLYDTGVLATLDNEHHDSFSLDFLSRAYKLDSQKDVGFYERAAEVLGCKADKHVMKRIAELPVELVAPYATADTRTTLELCELLMARLDTQNLSHVAEMEADLLPVLWRMERRGVRADIAAAEAAVPRATEIINRRQQKLNALVGWEVNTNSPAHMRKIFNPKQAEDGNWYLEDGTLVPKTDTGAPSLNKKVLEKCKHPAAALVRGVKGVMKMRDTFLLGHILGSHYNGRIHANYNQAKMGGDDGEFGTTSGRLSCNDPNLQQISKRDPEIGEIVRGCFLPEIGQVWGCQDWSQMDFRIMAHYLNSPAINAAYRLDANMDFHQLVADLTGLPRKATPGILGDAKAINLGLCFGMGKGRMAQEMGLPYEEVHREDGSSWLKAGPEAEVVFAKYHAAVPGVKAMLDEMTSIAKGRGFVRTGFGRRIRFPRGEKAYKAGAMIFQGTAADALKIKLIESDAILEGSEGSMIANVHDEIDTSLPMDPTERNRLADAMREAAETFDGKNCKLNLRTPIRASVNFGENWWIASK